MKFDYLVSIINNFTKKKKAEQTLRESDERYRLILENTYDGIYL